MEHTATEVVLAYIEGLRDPERFAGVAARAVELGKHIVVAKVGSSDAAQRAALSHTGHLAGEDRAYDAIFRRYGIVRVHDTEEMLDVAMALSWRRRRPGSAHRPSSASLVVPVCGWPTPAPTPDWSSPS